MKLDGTGCSACAISAGAGSNSDGFIGIGRNETSSIAPGRQDGGGNGGMLPRLDESVVSAGGR